MSDDTENKTIKSKLSPHVPEFVPAAFVKKKSQDDIPNKSHSAQGENPTRANYSKYNATDRSHREKDEKQAQDKHLRDDENDIPRKMHGKGSERQYGAKDATSWRQRDQDQHKIPKHSNLKEHSDMDSNWRTRKIKEENRHRDFKYSKIRTKPEKTENDLRNVPNPNSKTTSNFHAIKNEARNYESTASIHQSNAHKGFGRGRGQAQKAWTKDYSIRTLTDQPISRTHRYNQDNNVGLHNPDYVFCKVTEDDKLENIDNANKSEHNFHKAGNPKRKEKGEIEEDGWIQINKKKTPNKTLNMNSSEASEKDTSNNNKKYCERVDVTVTRKHQNPTSIKTAWKKKEESNSNDMQSKEGKISNSEKLTEPNIMFDENNKQQRTFPTSQYKNSNLKQKQTTDLNIKSTEIRILTKDESLNAVENSAKSNAFELVDHDKEFPDLRSANRTSESSSLASDWLSGGSRMPIISYSAALKAIPKPQPKPSNRSSTTLGTNKPQSKMSGPVEEGESQTKKKKKKKKKAKDKKQSQDEQQQSAQPSSKKTKQPLKLDLGDWLSSIEKSSAKSKTDKQAPKKVAIATGVLQIQLTEKSDSTTKKRDYKLTSSKKAQGFHNILDSTAPVIKRGKEREVPKKKKPSQLKKIILKEREEKKKALEIGNQDEDQKEETMEEIEDNLTQEEASLLSDEKLHDFSDITPLAPNDVVVVNSFKEIEPLPAVPSEDKVKAQLHSRRFREYCDNVMDKELNKTTIELLQKLVTFQDRQYHKDPVKSKAKRRFVVGLREVTKHLKLRKIKLVIISPNVERIKSAGGLDDTLHNIITIAHQNGVPVVFALRRQILGRVLHKKVPVSAIGVFNYDGAQDQYIELMDLTEKARAVYADRWKKAYEEMMEQIQKDKEAELSLDDEISEDQVKVEHQGSEEHKFLEDDDSSSDDDNQSEEETETSEKKINDDDSYDVEALKLSVENKDMVIEADINIEDL